MADVAEALAEAQRRRAFARGWLTQTSKNLSSLCELETVDMVSLSDAISEFDKRLERLDEVQGEVELLCDENEIDNEIETAADFRENARIPRVLAARKLAGNIPDQANDASVISEECSGASVKTKLPNLQLPTFNGEPMEWQSFWDQFRAIVDESNMSDVAKFSYLKSYLRGEAKASIQGLTLTSAHYASAVEILQQRFGRSERIIFSHIQELLNIKIPNMQISSLWKMQDDLLSHVRSLEALGITGRQFGVILTPVILSRLPPEIRLEWAREGEGREDNLQFLLDFLLKEIRRRENAESFSEQSLCCENVDKFKVSDGKGSKAGSENKGSEKFVSTASALLSSSASCGICNKPHFTANCWALKGMSYPEREKAMKEAGLCYRCLSPSHVKKQCTSSIKCHNCGGPHYKILCRESNASENSDNCHD